MTTWTLQDLSTPEEDEAWAKMAEEQEQREKADSFWNHRVVRSKDKYGDVWHEIAEVYYNRQGQPCGYCNSYVGGETMEELKQHLARLEKATTLPVLDAEKDFNNKWEDDYGNEE